MYPSNCDDIDISSGIIATCCYGTMVTMCHGIIVVTYI